MEHILEIQKKSSSIKSFTIQNSENSYNFKGEKDPLIKSSFFGSTEFDVKGIYAIQFE
jgi:hypothetical protein